MAAGPGAEDPGPAVDSGNPLFVDPKVAASGAWTADDVFTVKLVLYQTPLYSTLAFRFDGDRLLLDAEHHVAFGPTRPGQLVGRAVAANAGSGRGG